MSLKCLFVGNRSAVIQLDEDHCYTLDEPVSVFVNNAWVCDTDRVITSLWDLLPDSDVDIQVLGVGPDGHLGFNEPGSTLYDGAHEETLDDSTIEANKRFFASKEDVPTHAVTMGMGNIMRAKRLLMIISGNKQEAATKLLMEDKIDPMCPCTFMRMHRDATVVIEKSLADQIGFKG